MVAVAPPSTEKEKNRGRRPVHECVQFLKYIPVRRIPCGSRDSGICTEIQESFRIWNPVMFKDGHKAVHDCLLLAMMRSMIR